MKVSLAWLKEFVPNDLSAEAVADHLRRAGFDVPALAPVGGPVAGVVAAQVLRTEKHPNADKLKVCSVSDGKETFTVVCGAPNVEPGGVYPLARLGAVLPGGLKIEKRALRGVDSQGMMCSGRELGLSEDASGLYVLPSDTPLGRPIEDVLGLNDVLLEVEITPNRPDALSHWGLARELAAALGKKIQWPTSDTAVSPDQPSLVRVEEPALCPRYTARVLEGTRVGPSPLWLRLRLERCGFRSINNVVDVTNYVLLEMGHPLHAFDRDRLAEGRVVVRRGLAGEKLICLDGVDRDVSGLLVIADAQKPCAVAGVMGGQDSGVTENTRRLFLESAVFAPSEVRRSRGRLQISTESSYRFERGTDPLLSERAIARAAHLLSTLAGGTWTGQQTVGAVVPPRPVSVSFSRVSALLGIPLKEEEVLTVLTGLDFAVEQEGNRWSITPPEHRTDVRETADVAEEVARRLGYDRVPERRRGASQPPAGDSLARRLVLDGRDRLLAAGFWEVKNSGLISESSWRAWAGDAAAPLVRVLNPMSSAGEALNPSLLVNLLANAQTNRHRGVDHLRVFETARVFHRGEKHVVEQDHLAWVALGAANGPHWKFPARALEIWDAKSWMKSLVKGWRVQGIRFAAGAGPAYHPAESQAVYLGDRKVGEYGRLHPARAAALDLAPDTFLGELDLTALAQGTFDERRYGGLSRQPALIRDFSLVFPEKVSWSSLVLWLHKQFSAVESVELFDVFTGRDLPEGCRSLGFRVVFRLADRTLSDAEAERLHADIFKGLKETWGGEPRAAARPA